MTWLQDAIVTVMALAAAGAVIRRVFAISARPAIPKCSSCAACARPPR